MDDPLLATPRCTTAELRIDLNSPRAISEIIASPSPSYAALIASLKRRRLAGRSHSAPSVFTGLMERLDVDPPGGPEPTSGVLVRQALLGVALYLSAGVAVFLISGGYKGRVTSSPIDALYYTVVTLCTIGYGDIVPDSAGVKLFSCAFILVGFGFVGTVLNGLVLHVCDRQEAVLMNAMDGGRLGAYLTDREKGRVRIRTKVVLASAVVAGCVGAGTAAARLLEGLGWVDSFYLSVTSVTTVGYGDYAFSTVGGRAFAVVWLLVSTLAVARAFLYFAELRIDKRNRRTAMWVLQKKVTLGDLVAADLDNDGSISKSEFVIYKLREMGKVSEKDILQICKQFDSLEHSNCGKITLADILQSYVPCVLKVTKATYMTKEADIALKRN